MRKIFAIPYALVIGVVAGITTAAMIMVGVATPAHAGERCNTVGSTLNCSGQLHGGLNGLDSIQNAGQGPLATLSGGSSQLGGGHETLNRDTGQVINCVGSICP